MKVRQEAGETSNRRFSLVAYIGLGLLVIIAG
jgi:hypothetical protein